MKFRRSLYFVKPMKAGQVIPVDAVRRVRPGFGAAPKFLPEVIGRVSRSDRPANSPVVLDDLD